MRVRSSVLSTVGVALVVASSGMACQPGGEAQTGGVGGPPRRDRGALRGRAGGVSFGETGGARHKVVYEGGPKESWAINGSEQLPPELEAKPGFKHMDDHDVELLEPAPGAPKVELAVPDFCDDYSGAGLDLDFWQIHTDAPQYSGVMSSLYDLRVAAWAACDRMHYEPRQKVVQRLLQTYVNKTKMPIAELEKLLAGLAASPIDETFCGTDPTTRWILCAQRPEDKDLPRLDRLDMLEMRGQSLDEERFRRGMESLVASSRVDLQPVPLDRRGAVHPKASTLEVEPGGLTTTAMRTPDRRKETIAAAAVDAVDVQAIAWDTLAMTLLAREKNAVTRYALEKRFSQWRAAMEQGAASLGEHVAKAKALLDAWRKDVLDVDPTGIRAAFEAIEKPSASEACAKVEVATVAAVKRKAPATWKAATALLQDPAVDVLLQARQKCHLAEGRGKLATIEKEMLRRFSRQSWGPRITAYRTLTEWPNLGFDFDTSSPFTVRSVATKGDQIELRFEADVWEERQQSCVETNIIDRITWEGKIEYRVDCKSLPPIRHTDALPPMLVSKAVGEGVKKGNVVVIATDAGKPTIVYGFASKKDGAPMSNFLGAALAN